MLSIQRLSIKSVLEFILEMICMKLRDERTVTIGHNVLKTSPLIPEKSVEQMLMDKIKSL